MHTLHKAVMEKTDHNQMQHGKPHHEKGNESKNNCFLAMCFKSRRIAGLDVRDMKTVAKHGSFRLTRLSNVSFTP